nr:pentapeptide repeat-containing protein [Oscillatoria sp. PCC 10802]
MLNRVDLTNANLSGAYLQAYMRDVNLSYARLLGVTGILGANVKEELAIQRLQSEGVIFAGTTLPDGRIYTGHSPTV